MHAMDITALVFDFDGTLATCPYDFAQMRRVLEETAEEFGLPLAKLHQHGLLEMIREGAVMLEDDPSRAAAYAATAMTRLTALEYEAAAFTHLLPGVTDALAALRGAGFRLGIVTRNSTVAVQRILDGVALPVQALLCREDVPLPKPHTDHVMAALRLLDAAPARALMVGDHPMDIEMGKAAGMRTVAVLTGQSADTALRAADPDLLLPSVLELTALLVE